MPEGPSIQILKEAVDQFAGHKVISAFGTTIDSERVVGKKVLEFKTWGKHFLICFDNLTIKIHLLLFGNYLINEKKKNPVRLNLTFSNGEINFYNCLVKYIEGDINLQYDFTADVMNDHWNAKKAFAKVQENPKKMICDVLLEQEVFSGLGNIIKNEILYRTKIHPKSIVEFIPDKKLQALIKEARIYSFEFMKWKKKDELNKHWEVYSQKICHRCNLPLTKKNTGVKKRTSFYCENCQELYSNS